MVERAAPAMIPGLRRYSRHLLIPEIGLEGQRRLGRSRVLCIGAGGLGSPLLQYLAAAGVGRIGIVDDDVIEESNLQRQTIFGTGDIGASKAGTAARRVMEINPLVAADAIAVRLDRSNARDLVRLYDVVADCTDRFESRYLINDACVLEGKPEVYSAIFRFDGQVSAFTRNGPCYRCLFPQPPPANSVPSCAEGGILGVVAGITGTLAANEVLKILLGIGEPLTGRLALIDALGARVRDVRFDRDPRCAVCGDAPILRDVTAYAQEQEPSPGEEITAAQLDDVLKTHLLLDVREAHEAVFGSIEGAVQIPASELPGRLHELDATRSYVVACRVGARSTGAVALLRDAGFRAVHLRDGLLAYAANDPEFAIF